MKAKITCIKKLEKKQDVYDILGVEDNHNFVANGMVVHNCDLFSRGTGAIFVKDQNPAHDAWRIKDFGKLGAYTEFTNPVEIAKKLKKHPNFWSILKIPKPPKWLYDRYLKVRETNVYEDTEILKSVSKEDIYRALLILSLRDIMATDSSVTAERLILHIRGEYDYSLTRGVISELLEDSKKLITSVRNNKVKL